MLRLCLVLNRSANTKFSQVTIFIVGHNCPIPYNLNSLFTNHALIQCRPVRVTINKHNTKISQYSSNCYVSTTVITALYTKHTLTVPGSDSQLLAMEDGVQTSDGLCGINGEHSCTGICFLFLVSYTAQCS